MTDDDHIRREDTVKVFKAYGVDYDPDKSLRENWPSVMALVEKLSERIAAAEQAAKTAQKPTGSMCWRPPRPPPRR